MKLIRTKVRNVIGDADITAICKHMLNIYHGRQLFQENGTPVAGATLENTPENYIEWEVECCTYNYRPVRGHIYVNFAAGIYDTGFKSAIVRTKLFQEFQRLNRWGWRQDIYTDHAAGSNQFTIEKYDAAQYTAGADMIITVGSPFHTKYREFKFQWIISAEPSLFQYTTPGKYPKPYNLIASTSTIVIDVAHKVGDLEPGFRAVGFPPLKKRVDVVARTLLLSYSVGVDGHLYNLIGGAGPDSKSWTTFLPYTRELEKKPMQRAKFHLVKDLSALKAADDATDSGERCTICRVDVFDKYYQVERDDNVCTVCKFCAHYNSSVNTEMQSGNYKVAVAESATTAASLIEIAPMSQAERDVIRHLYGEVKRGTLEFIIQPDDELKFIMPCTGGIVTKSGATTIVGLHTCAEYQTVLEQVHRFPDNTRVFQYRPSW